MSGTWNRKVFLEDITVECAPEDAKSQAWNGLALTILDREGGGTGLNIEKTSDTTWKHDGVVEIPPSAKISFIVRSASAGDIGSLTFTKDDRNGLQDDNGSGNYLKRDFETGELGLKLSLLFKMQISTSGQESDSARSRLTSLGEIHLARFERTRRLEDISEAIENLQHAIQLFPAGDDADLPNTLSTLGISFSRRFEHTGKLDDISNAIQSHRRAVQLFADGHANLPGTLTNLGIALLRRFECTKDMNDISDALQTQERALQLAPDGHPYLPNILTNFGFALVRRFEHTGGLSDISTAIQHQQRAVQLTPDGHPHLPGRLINVGIAFLRLFERTGKLEDISCAIENQQLAIQLTHEGSPDLPDRLTNLGSAFFRRFEHTGDLVDISTAIENHHRAVQLTPCGHVKRPSRLNNLGIAKSHRFTSTGDVQDISDAIKDQKCAVELTPSNHPDLPGWLSNFGITLCRRFERIGDLNDIHHAIQYQGRAVKLTPNGHAQLPFRLSNLGTAFLCRFERTGDPDDISEAIQSQQLAVRLTPDKHPNLPGILDSLGVAFCNRFKRTGNLDDLSNAIRNQQRGARLTSVGDAGLLTSLGTALCFRFEHTGELDDISSVIRHFQDAVQATPDGHPQLPIRLTNLGSAFFRRFERTGDLNDISDAIRYRQQAVRLTPAGHPELPFVLSNLGTSFFGRYERTGDIDDVKEAIQCQQDAVRLTPEGHADLPGRLNNLGNTLSRLFERTRDTDYIELGIQSHQLAVQLTPDGHSDMPTWVNNLGNAFSRLFEHSADLEDIDRAIQSQQRAIGLIPEQHPDLAAYLTNVGNSYLRRFIHTEGLADISEAIRHYERAVQITPDGHARLAVLLTNLGNVFFHHFEHTKQHESLTEAVLNFSRAATSPTGPPSICLYAAERWANALLSHPPFSSQQLLDAHGCVIQLASLVSGLENTVQRRHKTLVSSSQLSTAAAAAALLVGDPDKALEWLVEGRCIVWNQINQLRTPLDDLRSDPDHQALADRLSTVSSELDYAGSLSTDLRNVDTGLTIDDKISKEEQASKRIKLTKERDQLLATIRDISGFEDFLRPIKCADIMRRLPDDGIIVILNVHKDRCDALALVAGASKALHILLPNISYRELERLAKGLRGHLLRHGFISRIGSPLIKADSLPDVGLAEVLDVLWTNVVSPILHALAVSIPDTESESGSKLTRIWWCPTGPLVFLPIHAAGKYVQGRAIPNECLSDFAVSSYIPTVNAILKPSSSDSVKEQRDQPQILGVEDEAKRISAQLAKREISYVTLGDDKGTVDGVLKTMESFPSIHLACHAKQNGENPLKSTIYLHDGPLELSKIMRKNLLYSDFAFLSACQTSTGDSNLTEEVVHLAAGMMAAGYRSVVGTMWSISDVHGPDMAEFFYENLLGDDTTTDEPEGRHIDGVGAARALHRAASCLREKLFDSPDCLLAWVPFAVNATLDKPTVLPSSGSDDNPLKADELSLYGDQFLKVFRETGDDKDIGRAITAYERAAACLSSDDPRLGECLHNIGIGYLERYESLGRLDDLQTAITTIKKAIAATADEDADMPGQLTNLGTSFCHRFECTGDLDDLSEAIRNQQHAVQLAADGHFNLPTLLNNLGDSFSRRFKQTRNLDDLLEAIQNQQRAVQLTPEDHPDLPARLNNLGNSFYRCSKCTGDLHDLSEAIRNLQRAVELSPDGHPDLPARLNNLGTSFCHRFECTGDLDDLSEAIRNQQSAVQSTPDGHADLSTLLSSLGTSFCRRFERTEAIRNHQHAVQLTPDGHPNFPSWLNNLGNSFLCRFEHTGRLEDLSEAIRNQQHAISFTPDAPSLLNNLGNSFCCRFERTGDLGDVSEAIRNQQRAVQLTPGGDPSLPAWLTNLGTSFSCRFEHTGDLDDLSEAIRNQEGAVQSIPDGHPSLPALLNNLGTSFSCRFEHTGDLDDLSDAIRNHQHAVQLIPDGHSDLPALLNNLGDAFSLRFERTGTQEFLSKAVSIYRLEATASTGRPSLRLEGAKKWARCSQILPFSSPEVLDAHACIIQLLSVISGLDSTVQRRHEALVDSSRLSLAAAAAAFSRGRPDKALEWLIEGRCIVWNQINQLRTPLDHLRSHDPALAERLSAVSQELENAGSRAESEMNLSIDDQIPLEKEAGMHIKLAKERDQLLATIRNIPGFEDFLQPRKCADIMRGVPDEGAIVIINIHSDRCDALALMAGASEPMHIPLSNFSYQEAERLAKGLRSFLLRRRVLSRIGVPLACDNDSPLPDIDPAEVLSVLWSQVVWPILVSLAFTDAEPESSIKPRIWWCPTGPLSSLPIHAAGSYVRSEGMPKQCLSDFAVSSYIPTVDDALLKTPEPNSIEKCGDSPTGLLIVSQPNTPNKTEILGAADEAIKVAKKLEVQGISSLTLVDQNGTVEGVLKAMESFPSIHLACHASQNTNSPLKSSIYLHDGPLELSEIMKKKLPFSDFAFLSACQTSTSDENLPEEVVHLAAGMLAAGYRSVVGTMWSIFDVHGPDLAEFFYEGFLEAGTNERSRMDGARAARALHRATQRLREKISDSPDSLLIWMPYIHIGI